MFINVKHCVWTALLDAFYIQTTEKGLKDQAQHSKLPI